MKDTLNATLAVLESPDWDFHISQTSRCIEGAWEATLKDNEDFVHLEDILGPENYYGLTMPKGWLINRDHIPRSKEDAIAAIRSLRDTGKVVWPTRGA